MRIIWLTNRAGPAGHAAGRSCSRVHCAHCSNDGAPKATKRPMRARVPSCRSRSQPMMPPKSWPTYVTFSSGAASRMTARKSSFSRSMT